MFIGFQNVLENGLIIFKRAIHIQYTDDYLFLVEKK
jgi:hypothetical protein